MVINPEREYVGHQIVLQPYPENRSKEKPWGKDGKMSCYGDSVVWQMHTGPVGGIAQEDKLGHLSIECHLEDNRVLGASWGWFLFMNIEISVSKKVRPNVIKMLC